MELLYLLHVHQESAAFNTPMGCFAIWLLPLLQIRITGWKRPLRSPSPTIRPTPPCLLNHIPKCHIHTFFEHLQGWGLHHLPGQPVPMPVTTTTLKPYFGVGLVLLLIKSFAKLVSLPSEPQKLSCNTLTKLRHYLEFCN